MTIDIPRRSPIDTLGTITFDNVHITAGEACKATAVVRSWMPDDADNLLDMLGLSEGNTP